MGFGSPFAGAGSTVTKATVSAFPSRGLDHPAARLAVRSLGMGALGPGGEIGSSVAVAIYDQAATGAAEGPLG
jgi:hypothetical protein